MNNSKTNWDEMNYLDCARGLYCPDAEEIKAMEAAAPLPPEEHSAADYDVLEVREMLAGMAADLKTLFQRGETLNRFSDAYADLCPQMLELLRTAGCALSTLYAHGEDVTTASVSILELRQLASFHFRKCQGAARAAVGRNERVYVRTSGLELQWAKLLLRLKQTEIRFSHPLPQPVTAQTAVVHTSVKPLQLESSASAHVLPKPGAIRAAYPLREQRPEKRPQPAAASMLLQQTEPAEDDAVLELDAETLRLLREYAELEAYRKSHGLRVSRETRLSDLFLPYGPEDTDPDSG